MDLRHLFLVLVTAGVLGSLAFLPVLPLESASDRLERIHAELEIDAPVAPTAPPPAARYEDRPATFEYEPPDVVVSQQIAAPRPAQRSIEIRLESRAQRDLYQRINNAYMGEDWELAARLVEEFLLRWPEVAGITNLASNIYGNWGILTHNGGRFVDALELLARAVELSRDNPEYFIAIGMTSLNLMDHDTAEEAFRFAAEHFPDYGRAFFGLGEIAYRNHELETAQRYFELALQRGAGEGHVRERLRKTMRELQVDEHYDQIRSNHFVVSYDPAIGREFARWALNELEKGFRDIGYRLGVRSKTFIPVILYNDRDFTLTVGAPHWASGIYDGKIRIPVNAGQTTYRERYRKYLRHELTHALVAHATGNNCPTWLNEGLAQVFEGSEINEARHALLLNAVRGEYLAPLDELENAFVQIQSHELAQLAYDQSLAAVEYLQRNYSRAAMLAIMERLREGDTLETALKDVIRRSYPRLLDDITRHYKARFRGRLRGG